MKNSIKSFSKARSRSSIKNKRLLSIADKTIIWSEENFKDFKFPLISNVEARPCKSSDIGELLVNQVVSRVRWRESVEYMIKKKVTTFIEIGPGNVLSNIVTVSYTHLTLPTKRIV